jgi:hypothetical protein
MDFASISPGVVFLSSALALISMYLFMQMMVGID